MKILTKHTETQSNIYDSVNILLTKLECDIYKPPCIRTAQASSRCRKTCCVAKLVTSACQACHMTYHSLPRQIRRHTRHYHCSGDACRYRCHCYTWTDTTDTWWDLAMWHHATTLRSQRLRHMTLAVVHTTAFSSTTSLGKYLSQCMCSVGSHLGIFHRACGLPFLFQNGGTKNGQLW